MWLPRAPAAAEALSVASGQHNSDPDDCEAARHGDKAEECLPCERAMWRRAARRKRYVRVRHEGTGWGLTMAVSLFLLSGTY